ncbi:MAG: hypothetical protein K1W16_04285 [Lachnospiraceae bacterium]
MRFQDKIRKKVFWILFFVLLVQSVLCVCPIRVEAVQKLSLTKAQSLAAANSVNLRKIQNKIEIQEIKYATAVKSIKMKKKNMATFRWTPLLSFKFPQKPTLANEYEWQYKPLQITCVINELKHQLQDELLAGKEKVSILFTEVYICQEKIQFYERSLEAAKETLKRNQIRLISGEASKADVERLEKKVSRLTTDISLQMRTFENKKGQLSKLIHLDVSSGYTFLNPFVEADIPRSVLDSLVTYTLNNDQKYYETKLETALSLESLNMMKRMMRNQYGDKMNGIEPYLQQALNGETIDSSIFKKAYNQMLEDIDAPWNGSIRILFIRINKEWFKGAVAGSRYVEDDPYALYSGALEYADAVREQQSAKEELTQTVRNDFETLKTAQLVYMDAIQTCDELEEDLGKSTELNRLGSFDYEELSGMQQEYEEQELATLELLGEYSKLLYAYDRLTCGGITAFLEGTDINMKVAQGGNSFLAEEVKGKAYYYIEYAVEDNLFRLGVSIPENYFADNTMEITHFALYVNEEQIGDKTQVKQVLEHLALNLDKTQNVKLYLYNEQELIDVCEIDASVYQDVLDIKGGYTLIQEKTAQTVATYTYHLEDSTGLVTLSLYPKSGEPIAYYRLENRDGGNIFGDALIPIHEEFRYLSLLVGDVSQLRVVFYNTAEQLLYRGSFVAATASITVEEE